MRIVKLDIQKDLIIFIFPKSLQQIITRPPPSPYDTSSRSESPPLSLCRKPSIKTYDLVTLLGFRNLTSLTIISHKQCTHRDTENSVHTFLSRAQLWRVLWNSHESKLDKPHCHYGIKTYGGVEVQLNSLLNSTLERGEW